MGMSDLYPFVLTDTALAKLRFVHKVIGAARRATSEAAPVANTRAKRRRSIKAALLPSRRAG
jgi:hypothetical protein